MILRDRLDAQNWKLERESTTAYFYNHAPWVAPLAYLHIVFRPATEKALEENMLLLNLPEYWSDFLVHQNGAILFSGALSIYGATEAKALLNRSDPFERLPFSMADQSRSFPPKDREREIVIGGYRYDGTLAVLDREARTVSAVSRKGHQLLKKWKGPDEWISAELERLSAMFDKTGRMLKDDQSLTIPKE